MFELRLSKCLPAINIAAQITELTTETIILHVADPHFHVQIDARLQATTVPQEPNTTSDSGILGSS